jgi:hypothetical protein
MSRSIFTRGFVTGLVMVVAGCAGSDANTGMPQVAGPGVGSPTGASGSGVVTTTPPGSVVKTPSSVGNTGPTTPTGMTAQPSPGTQTSQPTGSPMPCSAATVVATNCQTCHGATPIGGAPMSLMSYDDFHRQAKTMPSLKVYELAKMRINDKAKPMPQGGMWKTTTDFGVLDAWLGAGAIAGMDADKTCAGAAPPPATDGSADGSYGPITAAPGETCYDFTVHESTTSSTDPTPYTVDTGEHYEQFYYKAPWPAGTVATRYGNKFDNEKVLHHWLLFTTASTNADGYHETVPLPTLLGDNATLLAGWAVGGSNLALPDDVAFELPDPSVMLNAQWHFYNSTGMTQTDHTSLQICTVPAGTRPHVATITWIGTEDLNGNKWTGGAGMPPHQTSTFTGTCDPLREGMNSTEPIHVIGFWPHMHKLGVEMKAVVNHKGGMSETIFDKPFDFSHQIHYLQNYDLAPGDTLTAVCMYNNTTDQGAAFGESTTDEMCYNFSMAWPAHALENHVISLIGATNTCW